MTPLIIALLIAAAVPATAFPFVYGYIARGIWWRVPAGRALMTSSTALAVLLDYEVADLILEFGPVVGERVAVVILALIAAGAWLKLGALAYEHRHRGRATTPPTGAE